MCIYQCFVYVNEELRKHVLSIFIEIVEKRKRDIYLASDAFVKCHALEKLMKYHNKTS